MLVAVVVIVVFMLVLAVFMLVVMTMHGVAVEVDSSVEIAVGAVDEGGGKLLARIGEGYGEDVPVRRLLRQRVPERGAELCRACDRRHRRDEGQRLRRRTHTRLLSSAHFASSSSTAA